jgi:hypothetical protein
MGWIGRGSEVISFSSLPRPEQLLRCTQLPIQLVPGTLSPGLNWPEREADHLPLSSAEVKNVWSYTSTPNASSWRGALLSRGRTSRLPSKMDEDIKIALICFILRPHSTLLTSVDETASINEPWSVKRLRHPSALMCV